MQQGCCCCCCCCAAAADGLVFGVARSRVRVRGKTDVAAGDCAGASRKRVVGRCRTADAAAAAAAAGAGAGADAAFAVPARVGAVGCRSFEGLVGLLAEAPAVVAAPFRGCLGRPCLLAVCGGADFGAAGGAVDVFCAWAFSTSFLCFCCCCLRMNALTRPTDRLPSSCAPLGSARRSASPVLLSVLHSSAPSLPAIVLHSACCSWLAVEGDATS